MENAPYKLTNIDKISLETVFSIAIVARQATNGNQKLCF